LLRDIRDVAVGSLSTRITNQLQSLQGLHLRLRDIGNYLQKVNSGALPVNHTILGHLQDIFNLLPNLSTPSSADGEDNNELARAMSIKTNDQLMNIYLSSLIRAIIAFHDLIDNKIKNRQDQAEEQEKEKDKEKDKEEKEKKVEKEGEKGKKDDAEKKGTGVEKDMEL
jgi:26S proteasome regulatory subunit N8